MAGSQVSPPGPRGPGGREVEAAGVEVSQDTPGETHVQNVGGAENGAPMTDPLLALIVERWASLSPQQRLAVLEVAIRPTP